MQPIELKRVFSFPRNFFPLLLFRRDIWIISYCDCDRLWYCIRFGRGIASTVRRNFSIRPTFRNFANNLAVLDNLAQFFIGRLFCKHAERARASDTHTNGKWLNIAWISSCRRTSAYKTSCLRRQDTTHTHSRHNAKRIQNVKLTFFFWFRSYISFFIVQRQYNNAGTSVPISTTNCLQFIFRNFILTKTYFSCQRRCSFGTALKLESFVSLFQQRIQLNWK